MAKVTITMKASLKVTLTLRMKLKVTNIEADV